MAVPTKPAEPSAAGATVAATGAAVEQGADAAAQGLDALRGQLAALTSALSSAGAAADKLSVGQRAVADSSPWAGGKTEPRPAAGRPPPEPRGPTPRRAGGRAEASEKPDKSGGDPSLKDPTAKYIAKQFGIGKAALRAPVTAIAFDATKLAFGLKGMAQLDTVGQRAHQNLRLLFKGIDPSPAIRAFDKLQATALSPAGATGKALEGIFKRTFTSIFGDVDKVATLGASAFQGMVIAALYAEGAWLDARIALAPLTNTISELIGPTDQLKIAAGGGALALGAMAVAATGAAAPFILLAGAVAAVLTNIRALQNEWDDRSLDLIKQSEAGFSGKASKSGEDRIAQQAAANFERNRLRDEKEAQEAKGAAGKAPPAPLPDAPTEPANAAGKAVGKSLADGMVEAMADGAPAVAAAGKRLGSAGAQGAKEGADAHSPSRKTFKTGRDMGDGAIGGLDSKRAEVQAAGERSLVPDVGGSAKGAGGGQGASVATTAEQHLHFHFPGIVSGKADDMRAGASAFASELRSILVQYAVPVRP